MFTDDEAKEIERVGGQLYEALKENTRLRKLVGDDLKHEFFIVASVSGKLEKSMEDKLFHTKECAERYCERNHFPSTWVRRLNAEFVEDK